jgi:mRNA interferase MazF
VKRGEIYTAAARGAYTGKPRPVVVIQDDRFDATASITVCPFTTNEVDAPLLRIPVNPSGQNGLGLRSSVMIDKTTTVPKAALGQQIGQLGDDDLIRLNRSLTVFLGLASTSQP